MVKPFDLLTIYSVAMPIVHACNFKCPKDSVINSYFSVKTKAQTIVIAGKKNVL